MEAKDTVMSDEDIKGYIRSHLDEIFSKPDAWASERMLVQFQAEISFEAGIKEAVEITKGLGFSPAHGGITYYNHTNDETTYEFNPSCIHCQWQAKLKEWGV